MTDGDGNTVNLIVAPNNATDNIYTNPVVVTIKGPTYFKNSNVITMRITGMSIYLFNNQNLSLYTSGILNYVGVNIKPVKSDTSIPHYYSYENPILSDDTAEIKGGILISAHSTQTNNVDVSFPQDLKNKGINSITILNGDVELSLPQNAKFEAAKGSENMSVKDGKLIYDLSDANWTDSNPLSFLINEATISFIGGMPLSNLGNSWNISASVNLQKITLDFGTGATIFEITPDPIKLSLGEGLALSSATLTIEGTNTTCFKPELKISIDGNERESITLGETFTGTITFKEEDFGKMTGDGLPLSFKVVAKGQHTIDLTKPGDIRFNLLIDTDAAVGGGE